MKYALSANEILGTFLRHPFQKKKKYVEIQESSNEDTVRFGKSIPVIRLVDIGQSLLSSHLIITKIKAKINTSNV